MTEVQEQIQNDPTKEKMLGNPQELAILNLLPKALLHPDPVSNFMETESTTVLAKVEYIHGYAYSTDKSRIWLNLNYIQNSNFWDQL